MITTYQINEILELYRKFDWVLRRVLLTKDLRDYLETDIETLFADAQIIPSKVNAAWFSRPGKNKRESWELRALSENPFALLETFGEGDTEEHREKILAELQTRMSEFSSKKVAD